MRLYLSSFQLGNHPEELVRLVGENKKCGVIVNAADFFSETERRERLDRQIANMHGLGFQAEELDLRNYFGKSEKLEEDLKQYGLLWVKGGNAFVLKRAIEQTGFEMIIRRMLGKDSIVYAGYSAGVCVAAPTLKGLELVDDSSQVPDGYPADFSWDGMNLINYTIVPHYKSEHPESERIDTVIEYLKENDLPYKALYDGQVIIVNDEKEEII
ncbi:hypothetical protein BH11PAT2_BH11PAT2_00580 [soil metagenome]